MSKKNHPAVWFLILFLSLASQTQLPAAEPTSHPRQFIAHRGVHLRSTIAGENSLEAIRLARRAGFATIETDVRLTSDGQLVVMHDETLNRTCLAADGTRLKEPVPVASVTLAQLKADFVLRASQRHAQTKVPTLREFLEECRRQKLVPFIEPKINDATGAHYRDFIRIADEVQGRAHYIITSNNYANRVIRGLGINTVRLMGILYQTTFEEIAALGNTIMAISTSRFTEAQFSTHVARAFAAGIPTESHADDFARFAIIDSHAIDYVSTDLLAPDLAPGTPILERYEHLADYSLAGPVKDGVLTLPAQEAVRLSRPLPATAFGGIYLELEMKGECKVRLADQEFILENSRMQRRRYQLMVQGTAPAFELVAIGPCSIRKIWLTLAAF